MKRNTAIANLITYYKFAIKGNEKYCFSRSALFTFTIAAQHWRVPLHSSKQFLTDRSSDIRRVIRRLSDFKFRGCCVSDIAVSLDAEYSSGLGIKSSAEDARARCQADVGWHLHGTGLAQSKLRNTPIYLYKLESDFTKLCENRKNNCWYDIKVELLDLEKTAVALQKMYKSGYKIRPNLETALAYWLAYQTKATTLDQCNQHDRAMLRLASSTAMNHRSSLMQGSPALMRCSSVDCWSNQLNDIYEILSEQDELIRSISEHQ